jgi:hypothetical protein
MTRTRALIGVATTTLLAASMHASALADVPNVPAVPVPVPTVPSVQVPVPSVATPPAPTVAPPNTAQGPARLPSQGSGQGGPAAGGPPATPPAGSGSSGSGSWSPGSAPPAGAAPARSVPASSGSAHGGTAESQSPAARRRFDNRLRRRVVALQGCLPTLGRLERRVLILRAGVGAGATRPRSLVASRLKITESRVSAVERRALRHLGDADRRQRCSFSGSKSSAALDSAILDALDVLGPAAASGTPVRQGSDGNGGSQKSGGGGTGRTSGGVRGEAAQSAGPSGFVVRNPPAGGNDKLILLITGLAILVVITREVMRGPLFRRVRPYDDPR